ncbi:alpha/beta hydrolase [Agrilutibacter solisilvae]|uniref:Alpha/beta hydrolase n=1 Tax=Agrilutibacter solisilvae TaxID=2763317 RepID=A0A974XZM0_9GAMM|nr:alpha/beta hydrolase [Lysobacter solisilvae]QSX77745.1 alpha/beta hydrolase [Lysobacter solisilvae]
MNAIVRRPGTTSISTIVRNVIALYAVRLEFLLAGPLAPEAMARKAGELFTRPFRSSRSRALAAPTCGAAEFDLDIDGLPIHTYVWGDPHRQPYVLFAHGWSSHGTRAAPWLRPLQDAGYAVVAFDQAAHGRSGGSHTTLPDFTCHLLSVARHFGPAAAVIGHSLGGAAAALALARGLRAERAILIAPAADPLAAVERFSRFVWLAGWLGRRMFARFEQAMRFDATELQAHVNAPAIGRPALIVHDVEDREVPWSEGERWARFWPDSRLLSTRGLGHNRIADDAGVIGAALRFLRGEVVGDRVVSSPNLPYGFA